MEGSGDGQSFYRLGTVLARGGGGDPQPIDCANRLVREGRLVAPAAAARSDGRSCAIGGSRGQRLTAGPGDRPRRLLHTEGTGSIRAISATGQKQPPRSSDW